MHVTEQHRDVAAAQREPGQTCEEPADSPEPRHTRSPVAPAFRSRVQLRYIIVPADAI